MVFNHGALIPGQRPKSKPKNLKRKSNNLTHNIKKIDIKDIKSNEKIIEPEVITIDNSYKLTPEELDILTYSYKDIHSLNDAILTVEESTIENEEVSLYDAVDINDILTEEEVIKEIIQAEVKPKKKRKYKRRTKKSSK